MPIGELHKLIDSNSLIYHLENTSFGVMLWDDRMNLVYCSKEAAKMFGYTPDEIMHQPFQLSEFVHHDDIERVSKLIGEIAAGQSSHHESINKNLTRDGKVIHCKWYNSALRDQEGRIVNLLSLVQNMTSQVETELALKESQQQLSRAFDSAIDPMWLIRAEDGNGFRFESINAAFSKVTGWTKEQVQGEPIEKIIPATSIALVREKYNEALATGKTIDYVEEAQHPSGIKYGEVRVIPIHDDHGDPVGILGIANDITEKVSLQKKLEKERELRTREITSAAIKGQETERSKVSRELHDNVNQVLTTVKLYIELGLEEKIDTREALTKSAALINSTIADIRDLSKQLAAPSFDHIDFKETLSELISMLRATLKARVNLEFGDLPFSEMENELHLAMYRVSQEQLTNISKHAHAGKIDVSLTLEGSILRLSIADDGNGFDTTVKRTGIGITNMQSRVEILNGSFQIASGPGEGTQLLVEIPVIIQDRVCFAEQTVLNSLRS